MAVRCPRPSRLGQKSSWPGTPSWSWPGTPSWSWPGTPSWSWPGTPSTSWPGTPSWSWPGTPSTSWPGKPSTSWPGLSGPPATTRYQASESVSTAVAIPRNWSVFTSAGSNLVDQGRTSRRSPIQSFKQILPSRILTRDKIEFPLSWPMFEPFLPLNCDLDPFMPFHVDETGQPVTSGERRPCTLPVFPGSARDVAGDPDVKGAERLVGHDVNPTAHHRSILAVPWLRKCQKPGNCERQCKTTPNNKPVVPRTSHSVVVQVRRDLADFANGSHDDACPSRHGRARLAHLSWHGAGAGGPDEPGHDVERTPSDLADFANGSHDDACPSRHGPARPGHLSWHGAGAGGPDEPGHDVEGTPINSFRGCMAPLGTIPRSVRGRGMTRKANVLLPSRPNPMRMHMSPAITMRGRRVARLACFCPSARCWLGKGRREISHRSLRPPAS
jgi:hypothetical protein